MKRVARIGGPYRRATPALYSTRCLGLSPETTSLSNNPPGGARAASTDPARHISAGWEASRFYGVFTLAVLE
jgi:hypothetical protein